MVLRSTVVALMIVLPAAAGLTAGAAAQSAAAKPATAASSGPRVVATTLQLMRGPIKSNSDEVFKAAGDPPTSADAWNAAQLQALTLAETGNLLMIGSRAVDKTDWMKMARAMVDAAANAAAAAGKQNGEALATAGDTLYETCENCHTKYQKR